jgi:hypothetical protein
VNGKWTGFGGNCARIGLGRSMAKVGWKRVDRGWTESELGLAERDDPLRHDWRIAQWWEELGLVETPVGEVRVNCRHEAGHDG